MRGAPSARAAVQQTHSRRSSLPLMASMAVTGAHKAPLHKPSQARLGAPRRRARAHALVARVRARPRARRRRPRPPPRAAAARRRQAQLLRRPAARPAPRRRPQHANAAAVVPHPPLARRAAAGRDVPPRARDARAVGAQARRGHTHAPREGHILPVRAPRASERHAFGGAAIMCAQRLCLGSHAWPCKRRARQWRAQALLPNGSCSGCRPST